MAGIHLINKLKQQQSVTQGEENVTNPMTWQAWTENQIFKFSEGHLLKLEQLWIET